LDEGPIVNAWAVVEVVRGATAVADKEIDGFEFRNVAQRRRGGDGGSEEAGTDVACKGQAFELGEEAAEIFANMVFRIKLSPFGKG